jgi:hypothetical protein
VLWKKLDTTTDLGITNRIRKYKKNYKERVLKIQLRTKQDVLSDFYRFGLLFVPRSITFTNHRLIYLNSDCITLMDRYNNQVED